MKNLVRIFLISFKIKWPVKIYVEEDEETMIRLGEKDFVIKSESNLINFAKGVFSKVEDLFN